MRLDGDQRLVGARVLRIGWGYGRSVLVAIEAASGQQHVVVFAGSAKVARRWRATGMIVAKVQEMVGSGQLRRFVLVGKRWRRLEVVAKGAGIAAHPYKLGECVLATRATRPGDDRASLTYESAVVVELGEYPSTLDDDDPNATRLPRVCVRFDSDKRKAWLRADSAEVRPKASAETRP